MVYYYSRQGAEEYFDKGFGRSVKWDTPLLEGYPNRFLGNLWRHDKVGGFFSLINPGVLSEICLNHYDAIWLHGHAYFSDWLASVAARLNKTAIFYRSESSLAYDLFTRRPFHVRVLKPLMLRFLFSKINRFLACGTRNREFYLHYSVPPSRIFNVPYAVDNDYFSSKTNEFKQKRNEIRKSMNIREEDTVFLFAAKMISEKGPLELLQAYHELGFVPHKALIMLGDGVLRKRAESYTREQRLKQVHFIGVVNQSEMPKYYAVSDVFIRPDGFAQGDWGLTVNEAMASGLALIASEAIGATQDLVRDGENGFVVKFGDIQGLAHAMKRMVEDPLLPKRMGERSAEFIRNWSMQECVDGILKALRSLP